MNKPTYTIDKYGAKTWRNSKGQYHRTDGPAVEYIDGDKHWYINGQLHRVDGPAIEYANGTKYWFVNGKRHRTNGPAIEWADGDKEYWYKGKRIAEKVFYSDEFQVRMVMES